MVRLNVVCFFSAVCFLTYSHSSIAQSSAKIQADTKESIARSVAEIERRLAEANARPKKVFISPSTKLPEYAEFYRAFAAQVERYALGRMPKLDGKPLFGQLVLSVSVFQDGTIYQADRGIVVERGSGNALLDTAAISLVRGAAPFPAFNLTPSDPASAEVRVVTTGFYFGRESGNAEAAGDMPKAE